MKLLWQSSTKSGYIRYSLLTRLEYQWPSSFIKYFYSKVNNSWKNQQSTENLRSNVKYVQVSHKISKIMLEKCCRTKKTWKHKCTLRMNVRPVNSLKLLINQWCHAVTLVYNTQTHIWHKTCCVTTDGHVLQVTRDTIYTVSSTALNLISMVS